VEEEEGNSFIISGKVVVFLAVDCVRSVMVIEGVLVVKFPCAGFLAFCYPPAISISRGEEFDIFVVD
jgi:hypothetical protein